MLHISRNLHWARVALPLISVLRSGLGAIGGAPPVLTALDELRDPSGNLMFAVDLRVMKAACALVTASSAGERDQVVRTPARSLQGVLHVSRNLHRVRQALLLISVLRLVLVALGVGPSTLAVLDDIRDALDPLVLLLELAAAQRSRPLPPTTSVGAPDSASPPGPVHLHP